MVPVIVNMNSNNINTFSNINNFRQLKNVAPLMEYCYLECLLKKYVIEGIIRNVELLLPIIIENYPIDKYSLLLTHCLAMAVENCHFAIATYLLGYGADINLMDIVLKRAVASGYPEAVFFSIEHGSKITHNNNNDLLLICCRSEFDNVEILDLLVKNGLNVLTIYKEAFTTCLRNKHKQMVDRLIYLSSMDINNQGYKSFGSYHDTNNTNSNNNSDNSDSEIRDILRQMDEMVPSDEMDDVNDNELDMEIGSDEMDDKQTMNEIFDKMKEWDNYDLDSNKEHL